MKKHMKRMAAPKSWPIKRKGLKYITRPNPGSHSFELGLPLDVVLKDIIGISKTEREARNILLFNDVLVDGKRRVDRRFLVGFMDVVSISSIKKNFRLILSRIGKLIAVEIGDEEAKIKPCKITGKALVGNKIQINLFDGRNILTDKKSDNYNIGDVLVLNLPKGDIKTSFKLNEGMAIFLQSGKHVGEVGKIEKIEGDKIRYRSDSGEVFETLKKYAFVLGKDKPVISLK